MVTDWSKARHWYAAIAAGVPQIATVEGLEPDAGGEEVQRAHLEAPSNLPDAVEDEPVALVVAETQAQAVDAILHSAALARPRWAAPLEWGVGLLLVFVSWVGVPRAASSLTYWR